MKVLYVLEDSRFGGMNKMIVDLCAEFQKEQILAPRLLIGGAESGFLEEYIHQKQITYTKVNLTVLSRNVWSLIRYLIFLVPDIYKVIREIKKHDPDLIYCNGSQQIKGVVATRMLRKKIVWHMHDTSQPPMVLTVFGYVTRLFRVRWFVSSSQRTSSYYQLPPLHTLVSLPWINLGDFTSCPGRSAGFRHQEEVSVITVANVNTDKGIDTLVRTAAEVNKTLSSVNFRVIGLIPESQKAYWDKVNDLIKELSVPNVHFLGQRNDILHWLNKSDIYLCTSNNESGPLAVFEAMSAGLPVVTTDVGDLRRLFESYKYGSVHPVGDSSALAGELIDIITKPGSIADKIIIGKTIIRKEVDIANSISTHTAFYQKVLNH